MKLFVLLTVFMTGWNELIDPFTQNFTNGMFEGNLPVLGLIVILFFLMFILSLRFSAPLFALILIPIIFWVNSWAELTDVLILSAILFGAILGAALLKWYNKR